MASSAQSTTASPWLRRDPSRGRCAVAATALAAGAAVPQFSCPPYAALPLPSHRDRLCTRCFAPSPKLLRCTRCKWARYCGGACQRADWPAHKHECRALASASSPLHSLSDAAAADLLLSARCLWRRHDADASPSPADAAFDALEPGEPSDSDRGLADLGASLAGLLPPLPDAAASCARLLAAFSRNNFGVLNELLFVTGAGCYPPTALLNHSCAPNCVLAFDGATVEVRTLRAVEADEELTHSYVELCLPTSARRATLRARYAFECDCTRCTNGLRLPDGRDVDELLVDDGSDVDSRGARPGCARLGATASGDGDDDDKADARARALSQAAALLDAAAREDDYDRECALTMQALKLRRAHCDPLSACVYEAEGRALTVALACGDHESARAACRQSVLFLEMALMHVPHHPLLALQRFTLCDLERQAGDLESARRQMEACAAAVEVSCAARSALREQARAVLLELRVAAVDLDRDEPHCVVCT